MPQAEAIGVRYSREEGRVTERGDSYLVTCDCQEKPRKLTMGGEPWEHDCSSYGYAIVIAIDRDGHMSVEHV